MRLLLDLQTLQSNSRDRGIGRFSHGLAHAMSDARDNVDLLALQNAAMPLATSRDGSMLGGSLPASQVRVFDGLTATRAVYPYGHERSRASDLVRDVYTARLLPDAVHIASPFDGFGDDVVVGSSVRNRGYLTVATVFDFIPFETPELHLPTPLHRRWFNERLERLKRIDLVLAISEHTRRRAIDMLGLAPGQIVTVMGDADRIFRRLDRGRDSLDSILRRYGIEKPFIMHTGILEPRKNIPALVRAFASLDPAMRNTHQIVLAARASDSERESLRALAAKVRLPPSALVFAGHVPDEDLVVLYNACSVFAFPSLAEGFGLPPLEAMRCGCLAIGARDTSTAEVIGDHDLLFDPRDNSSIAATLNRALGDSDFRAAKLMASQIQQERFSWRTSAQIAFEAIELATTARKRRQHAPARSFGLVLPAEWQTLPDDLPKGPSWVRIDDDAAMSPSTIPVYPVASGGPNPSVAQAIAKQPGVLLWLDEDLEPCAAPTGPDTQQIYQACGYRGLLDGRALSPRERWMRRPGVVASIDRRAVDDAGEASDWIRAALAVEALAQAADFVQRDVLRPDTLTALANRLSDTLLEPDAGRLFVDVTELAQRDARSGVQRVVRNITGHLLREAEGRRVEPVYLDGDTFRYARSFSCAFLGLEPLLLDDDAVDFHPGDIFLGLDLNVLMAEAAFDTLERHRRCGLKIWFVVYDLLPLLMPDCFDPGLRLPFDRWIRKIAGVSDGLVAISRSVADEISVYLDGVRLQRSSPLQLTHFNLGGDLDGQAPSFAIRPEDDAVLGSLRGRTYFLKVGTIEPRKGHRQLLDAFDLLWAEGRDVALVLVGKAGWLTDALCAHITEHPEFGRRLFWLSGTSDGVLDTLYEGAAAVVQSSYGEGYGLPLIEAARHRKPVIARDIPVFREIAEGFATFFRGDATAEIAETIAAWLDTPPDRRPRSDRMPWITWRQSAMELLSAATGEKPYRIWENGDRSAWTPAHPVVRSKTARIERGRFLADSSAGGLLELETGRLTDGCYLLQLGHEAVADSRAVLRVSWTSPNGLAMRWEIDISSSTSGSDWLFQETVEIKSVHQASHLAIEHLRAGPVVLTSVVLTKIQSYDV